MHELHSMAERLQSHGRGDDSVLIHMTPGEVGGLRHLALASGGDLTINPHTGLPEAGFLSKILPMIAGIAGTFIGIPPMVTAAAVGGITGVAKGNLMDGLMAGLGAYGGASLGGAIKSFAASPLVPAVAPVASAGAPGAVTGAVTGATGAGTSGLQLAAADVASTIRPMAIEGLKANVPNLATSVATPFAASAAPIGLQTNIPNIASTIRPMAIEGLKANVPNLATSGLSRFSGAFADAAGEDGVGSFLGRKTAARLAGAGLALPLLTPGEYKPPNIEDTTPPYEGPYRLAPRSVSYPTQDGSIPKGEHMYFDPSISKRLNASEYEAQRRGEEESPYAPRPFNRGGGVRLAPGSFVADARTVSELGNGSGDYGKAFLASYGGQPVDGPGDGVSDSVRANIGGRQEARLSNGEVVLPPSAVERLGGSKALYALMDKAKAARRRAGRGSDTKVRAGLGAA